MKKKKAFQPKKKINQPSSKTETRHPDRVKRVEGSLKQRDPSTEFTLNQVEGLGMTKYPVYIFFQGFLFFLFCFLLPTQLGRHFFLPFSYISGVRIDYLAPTLYVTDLLAVLLAVINIKTVINLFRSKVFIILFILFFISGYFAFSRELFLYRLLKYVEVLALFSIFKNCYGNYKKYIIIGFAASVLFQIPLVVLHLITKHSQQGFWYFFGERYFSLSTPGIAKAALQGNEILRPYGTFSHPNSLAGFFLLIYLFFLSNKNIVNKVLKYGVLAICVLIIFFSFSKSSIITFLVLNAFYFLLVKQRCQLCTFASISSPLFLAIVFLSAQTDPASFEKRFTLFSQAFTILTQNFLTGTGLGNYLYAQSIFPITYPYFFLQPVHNIFLLFLCEAGVMVSFFVAIILFKLIKKNVKKITFVMILLGVTLTGFNDHYWLTLQQNLLLSGVLFGIVVYNKNEQTS